MSRLTLVLARGANGVIGADGRLPWRLASDMKRFKAFTMGKPVLMGRKTWESLPAKPLPGRENIVLTRDGNFRAPGAWVYTDWSAALAAARASAARSGAEDVCVIGGAAIFAAAMEEADRIVLTEVNLAPAGDVVFDELNELDWRETSREEVARGAHDDADFTVRVLERVRP